MTSLQRMNYCLYKDKESDEEYKKELERLIDRYISKYGGFKVEGGKLVLSSSTWGDKLSESAKCWFIENVKNINDFRDKIRIWLLNNRNNASYRGSL